MSSPLTRERIRQDIADVLDAPVDSFGPEDDLFEHGLDSLRLHSLISRWRAAGVTTGYVALAGEPTLEDWSRILGADDAAR